MIKVFLLTTKEGLSITVKGHAGYDEFGRDIVCSAVSALWYGFCKTAKPHLISCQTRPGDSGALCKNTRKGRICYKYFTTVVKKIAEDYPNHLLVLDLDHECI